MGTAGPREPIPIVEIGVIQEHFFTDIEIEIVAGRCARFLMVSQHSPPDCKAAGPENHVRVHCTTLVDLVPAMIRKTVFALGQYWGRDAVKGLLLPF